MIIAETPRLRLRHFAHHDVHDMAQVMGDPEVMKYSLKGPLSVEQTRDFLEDVIATYDRKGFGLWALEDTATGQVIGYCGYYCLISIIEPENHRSIRVAEKCGLVCRKEVKFHGISVKIYAIEAHEYHDQFVS